MRRVLLASMLVLVAGCELLELELWHGSDPDGELLPIEIGNQWIYENRQSETIADTLSRTVVSTFNDEEGYVVGAFSDSVRGIALTPNTVQLFSNGPDGVYQRGAVVDSSRLLLESLILPIDSGAVGSMVLYRYESDSGQFQFVDTLEVRQVATGYPLAVPAGFFICTKFVVTFQPGGAVATRDLTYYYAPAVGLVQQTISSTRDPERIFSTAWLISYKLN